MAYEDEFFRTLSEKDIWQRYCGFLDISIDEFMDIQRRLLMDQIARVSDSFLGKKILNGIKPKSEEEFRHKVPITTYQDYEPYLSARCEDVLAEKPLFWCHSAGRRGSFKWMPFTVAEYEVTAKYCVSVCILGTANKRGDINFHPGDRVLMNLAPPPYTFGSILHHLPQYFTFRPQPPFDESENVDFQTRLQQGFTLALQQGTDVVLSLSSIMVKMGQSFVERQKTMKLSPSILLKPRFLKSLIRARLVSKRQGRAMLPRDLCQPRAALTGGTDTTIYRDEILYYWGVKPFEFYGATDSGFLAMQNWNKKWMTFLPDVSFLEFIPEEETIKWAENPDYKPSTVLFNEVEVGKAYEIIITRFHGTPLFRYRVGDVIKFAALEDEETGVKLPQMFFYHRAGETIDLASLARLDERTIWKAIANTGIKYEEWSARKEYNGSQSFLCIYIELKEERQAGEVGHLIDEQLKIIDIDYVDVGTELELQPVKVTLLPPGTFQRYLLERQKEGADLAHLKPAHINAPDETIRRLLKLSEVYSGK